MSNRTENPMRPPSWLVALPMARMAPRCRAHAKSGAKCLSPAMSNGCCRMHGGASTGPTTPEGLERLRAARTIHGRRTAAACRMRGEVRALLKEARRLVVLV
jgi:hypothetical protein